MKRVLTILTLAAGLAPALPALAQSAREGGSPPSAYGSHRGGEGDGRSMTLAEFQARYRERLMRADTDHDGRISLAEFMAARQNRAGGGYGSDPAAQFKKLDTNNDGYVTPAEIDAVSAERFARMDADHDGVLTPQERAAARGRGAAHDGGSPVQPLPPPQ